jgi:hypothetical protein
MPMRLPCPIKVFVDTLCLKNQCQIRKCFDTGVADNAHAG